MSNTNSVGFSGATSSKMSFSPWMDSPPVKVQRRPMGCSTAGGRVLNKTRVKPRNIAELLDFEGSPVAAVYSTVASQGLRSLHKPTLDRIKKNRKRESIMSLTVDATCRSEGLIG